MTKGNLGMLPNHACATTIALRGRENHLSASAYYVNSVLEYGGAKKAVFQRANVKCKLCQATMGSSGGNTNKHSATLKESTGKNMQTVLYTGRRSLTRQHP